MESQLQLGKQWLEQLLNLMGLAANVTLEGFETVKTDVHSHWLNIDSGGLNSEQIQQIIGSQGESIDAIQYLANTVLNLGTEPDLQSSFVVELDGYRVERNRELAILTQEAVDKVKTTGQEVEIPGLSSAERKQVHSLLQQIEGLVSESRGQEPNRRLIVRFCQADPE